MLISESWLRTWLDTNLSIEEVADVLTMAGIEVDSIDTIVPNFSKVVLGKVIKVAKHPNADRLKVCTVNVGKNLEIICGAPNVTENMLVACAIDGAILPGNIKIKQTKMRGISSFGMLCSEKELGISNETIGIMDLTNYNSTQIGESIRELLNLNEKILTLKITPNRGDCLSVRGVAREIFASTKCIMKNPIISFEKKSLVDLSIGSPKVLIHDPDLCGRFSARIIKNVDSKVKTPRWIVDKLSHAGQKSISVLVDISNYVMLELGRPSHIFDYDKITLINKKTIDVRWAKKNEKIKLLNSEEITCHEFFGVIADQEGPVAIAGIMGGERSAVKEGTKNIMIETAFWKPDAIRGRAQNLRFSTEASHRFERGVDFESTVADLEVISSIIQSICGGELGEITDQISDIPKCKKILFRKSRCEKILGMKVSDAQVKEIFKSLCFKYEVNSEETDDTFFVQAPAYRFDIHIEEDLIEEVVRMIGYDSIPIRLPVSDLKPKVMSEKLMNFQALKDLMVSQDFYEVINYGFIDDKLVNLFKSKNETQDISLKLINPISSNMSVMRHTLIPGLINVLVENLNNQQKRIRIFELGRVFIANNKVVANKNSVHGVEQPYRLSALIHGSTHHEQWGLEDKKVDFFDMKKILENLLTNLNFELRVINSEVPFLHPGRGALIFMNEKNLDSLDYFSALGDGVIGYIGELHPHLCSLFDLATPPMVFEVSASELTLKTFPSYKKISKVPVVRRDLAFIVPNYVSVGSIVVEVLKRKSSFKFGGLLLKFEMFDLYQGKGISDAEKSLAFMVLMQDTNRTLEEYMVESLVQDIVITVEKNFAAKLRA